MVMPTGFYDIITERDMNAIVAYLRTLKPVKQHGAGPDLQDAAGRITLSRAREKPYTEADDERQGEEGLLSRDHRPLHGVPHADGHARARIRRRARQGGFEFPGPWGVSMSRNITSSKTKGIGDWTDDEIKRAITQGVSKDGSKLKPPMGFQYYATMTGDDLDAVVAYLRTVPAKE